MAAMTATEELRKLLDELGVEWREDAWKPARITEWDSKYGTVCAATSWETMGHEWLHLCFYSLTPEQAITATLGSGTCQNVHRHQAYGFECSVCRWDAYEPNDYGNDVRFDDFNYCPYCGCEVVNQ